MRRLLLVWLALAAALAAPAPGRDSGVYDYPIGTQKRAALVLDRLLIALQHALREERTALRPAAPRLRKPVLEPLAAPLQHAPSIEDLNEMTALQRRGQAGGGRGRVLRCYFNAVTCF